MRRVLACLVLVALAAIPLGCGGTFELPTEHPGNTIPSSGSYDLQNTWPDMDGVQDMLLTQGGVFYVLFNNHGGSKPSEVRVLKLESPEDVSPEFFHRPKGLFNPVAIAADRLHLYVLDQGDSCAAKYDVRRGTCEADPTPQPNTLRSQIFDYSSTWRVREYGNLGGETGDTISTFTDTTVAQPYGIAVDDAGRVYVSCLAVFLDSLQTNKNIRTRKFVSRVYRYVKGQRYPGVLDENMVGTSQWYRDSTWKILDGSGSSSISDARGIFIPRGGADPVYVADRGNNAAKAVSSAFIEFPLLKVDGQETGASFNHPEDIAVDQAGFFYVVDRDNKRVLRYSSAPPTFTKRVDEEQYTKGVPLDDPIAIAADTLRAYIGDRGAGKIYYYLRRP
jgi:NHL repeat-containing protein